MPKLTDPVHKIASIGPKHSELLSKLGIFTVKDLIFYFPIKYTDTTNITNISGLNTLENRTVIVKADSIKQFRTKFGKFITEAKVSDESSKIDVIWFNQPFLTRLIKVGSTILLHGKLNANRNKPQFYSPKYEVLKNGFSASLGTIIPVYSTTEGLSSNWIRSRIRYLYNSHRILFDNVKETIPQYILDCYDLIGIFDALKQIHIPQSLEQIQKAQFRLAFDELLVLQFKLLKRKFKQKKLTGPDVKIDKKAIKDFLKQQKFTPTKAQILVINEILSDFNKKYPANRLLQGDVGCGKTLVAAAINIPLIDSGYQTALMAPTAVLARQHYETFKSLFPEKRIKIKLITGSTKKKEISKKNPIDIIIGTHAILHRQKDLFTNLGLVIIDEQHRFGVKQRETLVSLVINKKTSPHKLTMTATPIPRSIALTLFSDLDISIIYEMPKGRIQTKTYLVPHSKRKSAYTWIQDKIDISQVFWICPIIEESDKLQTKAVITQYEKLENDIFPKLRVDMLHGRLSEEEKNEKINKMKLGKTDILVSTSVIEVGIDIPRANIMVIEGAERFGLAQLHQLRGRVGRRAGQKSWCFLFTSKNASKEAIKRLKYFSKENDGLKVSEYDLKTRGPGEVYGTKQAGIPNLKIAKITDIELIKKTREAAEKILLLNNKDKN